MARFETDAETWERILDAGLLHTGGVQTEHPFEPDAPVEIEAELDPAAVDPTDAASWWAVRASQAVEGGLREGLSFPPPAWREESAEPLLELVTAVFLDQGWDVERPRPDVTAVQVVVPPELGDLDLWVHTIEEQEIVTVRSIVRDPRTVEQVPLVLELAARLNGDLAVGSFEADPDVGTLTFKVGIDVEDDRLSVALLGHLVGHAVVAAQRVRPVLAAVLAGELALPDAASQL